MLVPVAALIAIATVWLRGGRLRRFARWRLRDAWLVFAALGLQILLVGVVRDDVPGALAGAGHVLSYLLAGAFAWRNRTVPGLAVVVLGGCLNLAAIAANGGVMPASAAALERAGKVPEEGFSNSAAVEDARLPWLGDVFAVPEGVPFANVFSAGDVLLVVGVGLVAHRVCGPSRIARPELAQQPRR